MKEKLTGIVVLLTLVPVASAEMVEWEVVPANIAEYQWQVSAVKTDQTTIFTFFIPFDGGVLPAGTSSTLEVFVGTKLASRSRLALQLEDGKTCFRVTVGNDFLTGSKFCLTRIDVPHPSGDIYWAELAKFAKPQKKP